MDVVKANNKAIVPKDDRVFKIPAVPKKKVLDEEEYTKDLEQIIERDFFPDLEKLRAQSEYIAAEEKNDLAKMRELQIKYGQQRRRKTTPAQMYSPATFETPEPSSGNSEAATPRPGATPETGNRYSAREVDEIKVNSDADLPLDKYLSKNTSEDNASFAEILQLANEKNRLKQNIDWQFDQETEHEKMIQEQMALPSVEMQALTDTNSKTGKVDGWTYKARNALMYVPEGVEKSLREQLDIAKKKAREIIHDNTRFVGSPWDEHVNKKKLEEAATQQAAVLQGKIGVDGKEVVEQKTPNINGYNFVATPSPAPGVDESPLMTWGEIEGTPFRLDGSDTPLVRTPGPQFKIPNVPKRDQIALDLAEKNSAYYRKRKEKAIRQASETFATPSPKFGSHKSMDRLQTMSPAAQRLASSKLKLQTGDQGLRASYSPSPSPSRHGGNTPSPIVASYRSSTRSRLGLTPSGSTPTSQHTSVRTRRSLDDSASLTDNLLNIPAYGKKAKVSTPKSKSLLDQS